MDQNLFLEASRKSWRFTSSRGELTTEQLWSTPLVSKNGFSLNDIAIHLNTELKSLEEESFVAGVTSARRTEVRDMLELVKQIIAIKQAEQETAKQNAIRSQQKQRILQIIAQKRDEQLSTSSVEELEKMLADL